MHTSHARFTGVFKSLLVFTRVFKGLQPDTVNQKICRLILYLISMIMITIHFYSA